jgi:hypothetical protein
MKADKRRVDKRGGWMNVDLTFKNPKQKDKSSILFEIVFEMPKSTFNTQNV